MTKALARFTIGRDDGQYIIHIEDESGDRFDLRATYDQLDLISEEIEEQLDADEDEALGIDEDDEE